MKIVPVISDEDVAAQPASELEIMLDHELEGKSEKQKQIKMQQILERYVSGMRYQELRPKNYSSNTRNPTENVAFLKAAVLKAWSTIKEKKLALFSEAQVPAAKIRELVVVGTKSRQRAEMECADSSLTKQQEIAARAIVVRDERDVKRAKKKLEKSQLDKEKRAALKAKAEAEKK